MEHHGKAPRYQYQENEVHGGRSRKQGTGGGGIVFDKLASLGLDPNNLIMSMAGAVVVQET